MADRETGLEGFGQSSDPKLHALAVEANINRSASLALQGEVTGAFAGFDRLLSGPPDPAFDHIAGRHSDHKPKTVEESIAAALRKGTARNHDDRPA
jgi:hypothetical protein